MGQSLNLDTLIASAARNEEAQNQAFLDGLRAMNEARAEYQSEINRLLGMLQEQEKEELRQQMERKIEAEAEASAENVRNEYAREHPAEWNESETDKQYSLLLSNLFPALNE